MQSGFHHKGAHFARKQVRASHTDAVQAAARKARGYQGGGCCDVSACQNPGSIPPSISETILVKAVS